MPIPGVRSGSFFFGLPYCIFVTGNAILPLSAVRLFCVRSFGPVMLCIPDMETGVTVIGVFSSPDACSLMFNATVARIYRRYVIFFSAQKKENHKSDTK